MKRLGLLLILAAIVAPSASGHPYDKWYWSPERAASKLATSSRAPAAFHAASVSDVDCVPMGSWIWSTSSGPRAKVYKHFDCGFTVNYADGSYVSVERILHVISAQDFVLSTL